MNHKISVLLVDDHPLFRKGLRVMLEEEGITVVGEAEDGEEAVAKARELAPDVVVMDISMPGMDGIEATRRTMAEMPGSKVLPLSIHSGKRFVENMLRAGAAGYVLKESAPEDLVEAIRKVHGGDVFLSPAVSGVVLSEYMRLLDQPGAAGAEDDLTEDEEAVLRLTGEGYGVKEISVALDKSTSAVQAVNRRLVKKLGLGSGTELAEYAAAERWANGESQMEMQSAGGGVPILATKLHPPSLPAHFFLRSGLVKRLDAALDMPLTLVSAPAGFGKSTLVAHWLTTRKTSAVWVSLDEYDSDPVVFARYVVAAIEARFPGACPQTGGALKAGESPTPRALGTCLANDVEALPKRVVLVLDDYHLIAGVEVHALLTELIQHPPDNLRLVIVTRFDPPLALSRLRACGMLCEISLEDLQLSEPETGEVLSNALGYSLGEGLVSRLHALTGGWFVGLHLVAVASRHREDAVAFLSGLDGNIREIQEFLLEEVLSQQTEDVQDCMLQASLPQRLNGSFCEKVCAWHARCPDRGAGFMRRLSNAGLPMADLDGVGLWHRGHGVFREMLLEQLKRRRSAGELRDLHGRVARWLAGEGFIDEAARHALDAGDPDFVIRLVEKNRHDLINRREWALLERLLAEIPPEVIDLHPGLMITRAWILEYRYRFEEAWEWHDRARKLLKASGDEFSGYRGEIEAMQCVRDMHESDSAAVIQSAQRALEILPGDAQSLRSYVLCLQIWSYQMRGRVGEALAAAETALAPGVIVDQSFHTPVLSGLALAHGGELDLGGMRSAMLRTRELGERFGDADAVLLARRRLGTIHFLRNELREAEVEFCAVAEAVFAPRAQWHICGRIDLALCALAADRIEDALQQGEILPKETLTAGAPEMMDTARGLQAELALRQGRIREAVAWAREYVPAPLQPAFQLFSSRLLWVRIQMEEGSSEALKMANAQIEEIEEWTRRCNNKLSLAQMLPVKALLLDGQGRENLALEAIREALDLAERGRAVRLFLDHGAPMADLLDRAAQGDDSQFVREVLEAFHGDKKQADGATSVASPTQPLIEPLTNRELDVLELIGKRLYDKEIADRLSISPGTVKSHLKHIYQKLNVGNRREAVDKARALGML